MIVRSLHIYPVKSLRGIDVKSAMAGERGLSGDRRWMLVDKDGRFVTQRKHTQLCHLKADINKYGLVITDLRQHEQLEVNEIDLDRIHHEVTVWDDCVDVRQAPGKVNEWLSERLAMDVRLVYQLDESGRKVDPDYVPKAVDVSLSDGYPYLLTNTKSLDDLNGRMDYAVPMERFRPNIVVDGEVAFEEDKWRKIRIGTVTFQIVKPCARCVFTTVDQATGEKGKEPLLTLSKYRNVNGKVLFGQNMIVENEGRISAGDRVEIIDFND